MTTVQLIEFIVVMIAICTLSVSIGIGLAKLILFVIGKITGPKYEVYVHYQPNPVNRTTTDCSIRAVSKIFDTSWVNALDIIVDSAKKHSDQTNCCRNLNTLLYEKQGMHVYALKRKMTFEKFAHLHPIGTFALNSKGHICACIDGKLYDSYDPRMCKLIYYSASPLDHQNVKIKDKDVTFDETWEIDGNGDYGL